MTLQDQFRALSPVAQLGLAGAAALVLMLGLGGAYLLTRPQYEVLFTDLRPADGAVIVEALEEANVPYRLRDGGTTILTTADQVDAARLRIAGSDLPLQGAVGFELFNRSDMGLTEFAQRINYQRALQGELARTIMTIRGVETARVHLTLSEPTVFRGDQRPPKASVTLIPRAGQTLSLDTVEGVRRLVAAAVTGLDPVNVVVMNERGEAFGGDSGEGLPQADVAPDQQQLRAIEQYYAARVRAAISQIAPDVTVEVLAPVGQWGGFASTDAVAARAAAVTGWTPAQRDFWLRVRLTSAQALDETQQAAIRLVTLQALSGPVAGDEILFSVGAPLTAPLPPAPAPTVAAVEPTASVAAPDPFGPATVWTGLLILMLGLAVGLGLWLLRRDRRPRRLSAEERQAFAERLRRLIEDETDAPAL